MEHTNKILIIGGVHLDILTNYIDNTANTNFRDGTISIGIGGVGFNITANLKCNNFVNAKLFTVINNPEESFSGMLIQDALKKRGMSTDYVKIDNRELVSETGFVGIMNEKNKFEFGITYTGIDSFDFVDEELKNAIVDSDIIAVDCNLESTQINTIRELCSACCKPLFICSVSENRVERALKFGSGDNFKYEVFSLNRSEIKKAVENQPQLTNWESFRTISEIKSLCDFFHTEYLVVTSGQESYLIFSSSGNRKDGARFNIPVVVSSLGADDALFAAIIAHYAKSKSKSFNWDECRDLMQTFLRKVLRSHTTTPSVEKKRNSQPAHSFPEPDVRPYQSIRITHNSMQVTNNYNASIDQIQNLIRTLKNDLQKTDTLSVPQKELISTHVAGLEHDIKGNPNPSKNKRKEWYNQLCLFIGLINNSIGIINPLLF